LLRVTDSLIGNDYMFAYIKHVSSPMELFTCQAYSVL
jgi:hypothetical protein